MFMNYELPHSVHKVCIVTVLGYMYGLRLLVSSVTCSQKDADTH